MAKPAFIVVRKLFCSIMSLKLNFFWTDQDSIYLAQIPFLKDKHWNDGPQELLSPISKENLNIPLSLQWRKRTNRMIVSCAWSQISENLNYKLHMCWNICHVELFNGRLSSTYKISSHQKFTFTLLYGYEKVPSFSLGPFLRLERKRRPNISNKNFTSIKVASTCFGEREYSTREIVFGTF